MKKKIKLGALIIATIFVLILALSYISIARLKGKESGKRIIAQQSHEIHRIQNESRTEMQTKENQTPSDFVGIRISPEKQQLIGVKTEEVAPRRLIKNIRTVGIVEADERKIAHVHTKFSGWIKDMFVYEGQYVKHGDPLFTIYSPELVSSQEEYLLALKAKDTLSKSPYPEVSSGADSLLEATKRRFHLWDISDSELKRIERIGKPLTYITIYSHVNGHITKRMVFPGMRIEEHQDVLILADLSNVWVIADVYEYELPLVKEGQEATLQLSYYPGETFTGKVMYIYPTLNTSTRTVKVRFDFPNPDDKLKPGMYANVKIQSDLGKRLSVAEDSVIDTGERKIAFVAKGNGYFEPREIRVGNKADGYYEVIEGLREGERVVRSAAFFVDSESRLKAALESISGGKEEPVALDTGNKINEKSDIKISFSTDPSPPQSGKTTFKFKLTDSEGKSITDAQVKFTIIMPAMPGMAEMRSAGDAKYAGDGLYSGKLNIPMSGSWILVVRATIPGRPPVSESFHIDVR
jgi:Cu(I)/Ag(I) efflux system membrane fusion protein